MKYYSEKLKKLFDTEKDLKTAEKEQEELALVQKKELDVKKELAKEVENAYMDYVKTVKDSNVLVANANKKYLQLRSDFIKKYGSYHMTYTDKDGITIQTDSIWEMLADWLTKF